jgi:hypothetical protein
MPTAIPWSAIVMYADAHGLSDAMRDDLIEVLTKADRRYMAKVVELRKKEMERKK